MPSHPTSTDRHVGRRSRGRRATALTMVATLSLALAAGGCGKDEPSPASQGPGTAPTTSAAATATTDQLLAGGGLHGDPSSNIGGVPGPGGAPCVSKAPGEAYTEAEAVILFSPETICPGYVTVPVGVPVTFDNRDSAPHLVTLTRGLAPDAPVVATERLAGGQTWRYTFDAAGDVTFRIDAIPTFVGTITVLG